MCFYSANMKVWAKRIGADYGQLEILAVGAIEHRLNGLGHLQSGFLMLFV